MRSKFGLASAVSLLAALCVGCSGSTSWDEASSKVGETAEVCGPLVSYHHAPKETGDPTFLNLGADYDDPTRFTIVVWDSGTEVTDMLEGLSTDGLKTCATGEVSLYEEEVAQIELTSASDLSFPELDEVDGPDPY